MDLKQEFKQLYNPSAKDLSIVTVPPLPYLMIDGEGDPNSAEAYKTAVQTLYTLAYSIRAISKAQGTVYSVMPLEGLWSFAGETAFTPVALTHADKARFLWTMMILQPAHITADMVEQARAEAYRKKKLDALHQIRHETYAEGEAVQILHLGSYDDEAPTVARLHEYIEQQGYRLAKRHHEIYLSDPSRVAAEKLKTIIRIPFSRNA